MRASKRFPVRTILYGLALLCLTPGIATAERSQSFGDYKVHYNAVATVMLEPDVARQYGIQRSQRRGLLTVSLQRQGEAAAAAVNARGKNLAGQGQAISMRKVTEDDAIYYIGTFSATQEEELEFKLTLQPKGAEVGPFEVVFDHVFYGTE